MEPPSTSEEPGFPSSVVDTVENVGSSSPLEPSDLHSRTTTSEAPLETTTPNAAATDIAPPPTTTTASTVATSDAVDATTSHNSDNHSQNGTASAQSNESENVEAPTSNTATRETSEDPKGKKRLTGKALRWTDGGFGFIRPDLPTEKDIFCHSSNILDGKCLREGDRVEYEKGYDEDHRKWRAENVTGGSELPPGSVDQICFAWRDGHCSRGDTCKFSHKSAHRERDYDRRSSDRDYGYDRRYDRGYDRYDRDRDYYRYDRRDSYDRYDRPGRDYGGYDDYRRPYGR